MDLDQFNQDLEAIEQAIRATRLERKQYQLQTEQLKTEQAKLTLQTEQTNLQITTEHQKSRLIALNQVQTNNLIDSEKLGISQTDLKGYQNERQLKGIAWQLKLQNLKSDLSQAQNFLKAKLEDI